MPERKRTACLTALCLLAALLAVLLPAFAADDEQPQRLATVNYSAGVNLREGPSTGYSSLRILPSGTMLNILGEARNGSTVWYRVSLYDDPAVTGYVHSGYVIVSEFNIDPGDEDADFEAYLEEQGFPESYRTGLRLLHALYPEWVFEAVHTGLEWKTVLEKESAVGRNLVPRSSNPLWINRSDVDKDGNQIGRDGYNWVAASPEIIAYYLDPRNFFTVSYIFQFETLSFDEDVQVPSGTQNILAGTFMDGATVTHEGTSYTYAEIFQLAGQSSGISPYHLASRARQEQGTGGTQLSFGSVPGYEGYYNFFNINAYTSSLASATVNGAIHAKNQGWTDPYLSIVGGSAFIGRAYIARGQDTLYFQKFNVVNTADGLFSHQYMTNVMAPASEAGSLRAAYADLHTPISFKIPVYLDMPEEAVKQPTEQTVPTLTADGYTLSDSYILGVPLDGLTADVLPHFSAANGGSVEVRTAEDAVKTDGVIATGDKLTVLYAGGTVWREYTFVVKGDVNGDGAVTILDLLQVQKHLLDVSYLSDARMQAAELNGDGRLTILDLLRMQKHLLGIQLIGA